MLTDIKLSKAQCSKVVQSGGFHCSWLGDLGKKVLSKLPVRLAKDALPKIVTKATSSPIDQMKEK